MKLLVILLLFLQIICCNLYADSIVCIHGFFRSYTSMRPIGNALRNEGFHIYLWDYPTRRKTIEAHAEDLVRFLALLAKTNPGEPIHFVTHSLGGIIARVAVNHPDCPQEAKIGKAVLLAPPNKGARLARTISKYAPVRWVFGKKTGEQLMTYKEEDMEQLGKFPESMQVMVIAGAKDTPLSTKLTQAPNDGKVTVDETFLSTPHTHQTLFVGHSWIMTSRQTIHLTRNFLLSE